MLRPALEIPDTLPGRRLQLGEYALEIDARELRRPGARRGKRLTVKAQQVLLALALRPGEVLTRETLMDAVWPNSYPTGDVLTQAIVQLRRALDDDADAPRFIETIARSGYRLLGEVSWSNPSAEPLAAPGAAAPPRPSSRAQQRWWLLPLVPVALIIAWAGARWWPVTPLATPDDSRPADVAASAPVPRILAASPDFEHEAVLSPDGQMLVFVIAKGELEHGALFLQSSAEFTSRQLTRPPEGAGDGVPAWSPDQRSIAFRRLHGRGEDARCELRVVSVASAAERLIGPCAGAVLGMDFTADGRELIVGGYREEGSERVGLRRIDLASGSMRPIAVTGEAPLSLDRDPRVSADGQTLLFRRGMATSDLFSVPIEGGVPQPMTAISGDIRGHDWLGADGAIVFSRVNEHGIQLYRLAGAGVSPEPLEVSGVDPRSDAAGQRIVFQQASINYVIRSLDTQTGDLSRVAGLSSSRNDMLPSPSPDGQRVAFYSDRSGEVGLWLAGSAANSPAEPVDGLFPHPRFAPVWSADARHLLVVAQGPDGNGLHEVEAASRRARYLGIAAPIGVVGYLDAQTLLVNRGIDGGFRLALHARDDGRELATAGIEGVGYLQIDRQGERVVFTREGVPGLHVVDVGLSAPRALRDDLLPPRLYRGWRIAGEHLWFLRPASPKAGFSLWSLPLSDLQGEPRAVAQLHSEGDLLSDFGVLAGEQLDALWLSEQSPPVSDIALLELPPAATPR